MGFSGFRVVLTGDESLVSTYHRAYLGFASALPMDVLPAFLGGLFFPTESGEHGRMLTTQYGLCKVEAALLESGFSRDEVAIVDPRRLDEAVGPETRVIGVSVLDPLGVSYGTMLLRVVLRLMGIETRLQSYMSWATMKILEHPAVKKYRSRVRVVVGGPGAWEIVDSGLQRRLGVDTVVEGEGELVAPALFREAIEGAELPSYVRGPPVPVEKIPVIRTPSRGLVEISRGCGRGCKFCNPTLLMYRVIPEEKILREVAVNVLGGESRITLHSEDFLRYGSLRLEPGGERVKRLLERVVKFPGVEEVKVDFATPSTVMQDPKLVRECGEILGLGGRRFSIIEVGIESASSRLIRLVAPGKPLPFKPEEWPRVVEDAIRVLNDAGWWVCATLITGLPGEREEDVEQNIKLVERLEPYNVFVFVLPFIPSGSLRRAKGMSTGEILALSERSLELVALATLDAIKKIRSIAFKLVKRAPPGVRQVLGGILYFASTVGLKSLERGLRELHSKTTKSLSRLAEGSGEAS